MSISLQFHIRMYTLNTCMNVPTFLTVCLWSLGRALHILALSERMSGRGIRGHTCGFKLDPSYLQFELPSNTGLPRRKAPNQH